MGKKAISILFISIIMVLLAISGCQTTSPVEPIAPVPLPAPLPESIPEPAPVPEPVPEPIPEPEPQLAPVEETTSVQWTTMATEWRGRNGERFTLQLPPGGIEEAIWGTGVYTDDSVIGTAAVHAGIITFAQGGSVTIEIRPGETSYVGSMRNGIYSHSYDQWEGSFVFIDAEGKEIVVESPPTAVTSFDGLEEVPAFGSYFKVSNYAGYDFYELRISTDEATARDPSTEDLLGTEILYDLGSFRLDLDNHPELKAAIQQNSEDGLYLWILDEDNDGYLKRWHPKTDPWNIIFTVEDLDDITLIPSPEPPPREEPVPFGDYFLMTNDTGYDFTDLHIYSVEMMIEGDIGPNLLGTELLRDQESLQVFPNDFPKLAEPIYGNIDKSLYVIAVDVDGDQYARDWDPSSDSWNIVIDFDHIVSTAPEEPTPMGDYFQITNNTGYDIHYLDIYSDEMLEKSSEGFNLLGADILFDRESFQIYPAEHPGLAKAIFEGKGEVLHIEIYDEDDDYYYRDWIPDEESWDVEITIGDFVDREEISAQPYGEFFQIINDTGYEIWYLYLVTEEMWEANELGEDLLQDWLLYDQESLTVYPDKFPRLQELLYAKTGGKLYFIAYDEDDYRYRKEWTPDSDSWDIVISGEDFLDY